MEGNLIDFNIYKRHNLPNKLTLCGKSQGHAVFVELIAVCNLPKHSNKLPDQICTRSVEVNRSKSHKNKPCLEIVRLADVQTDYDLINVQ